MHLKQNHRAMLFTGTTTSARLLSVHIRPGKSFHGWPISCKHPPPHTHTLQPHFTLDSVYRKEHVTMLSRKSAVQNSRSIITQTLIGKSPSCRTRTYARMRAHFQLSLLITFSRCPMSGLCHVSILIRKLSFIYSFCRDKRNNSIVILTYKLMIQL